MNAHPSVSALKQLGDASLDAVLAVTSTGVIVYWNERARDCFGWTSEEALGRYVHELIVPPRLRRAHLAGMKRVEGMPNPPSKRYIVDAIYKGENEFEVELSLLHMLVGETRLTVCFARNVTEERDQSRMMKQATGGVIHLNRLNAMSAMAAALAHELSQPITAAQNYVGAAEQLLSSGGLEESALHTALKRCDNSIARASEILASLRLTMSKGKVDQASHSLTAMINEAWQLLPTTNDVGFNLKIEPGADRVFTERVKVEQVFLNLFRNAVEAIGFDIDGLVEVLGKRSGDSVIITVDDNGHGLSADCVDRLFQATRSSKSEGMGLGLSICRALIDSLGGQIWAEPKSSRGARFCFSLPAASEQAS
jgi:two-component system sensor kinase FixL